MATPTPAAQANGILQCDLWNSIIATLSALSEARPWSGKIMLEHQRKARDDSSQPHRAFVPVDAAQVYARFEMSHAGFIAHRRERIALPSHSFSRRGYSVLIHVAHSRVACVAAMRFVIRHEPCGADVTSCHRRRVFMNATKLLGLAAVGACLLLAAPAQQARALSLSNPGAAAAVQTDTKQATTEVHWRHHHWHRWHHRHHGWHRGWHRGWHHRHRHHW